MVCTSAPNAIVLQAQRLQVHLVAEHGAELAHRVIVQVIIVQEDLLQTCVVDEGTGDGFEALISNQV